MRVYICKQTSQRYVQNRLKVFYGRKKGECGFIKEREKTICVKQAD